MVGHSLILKKSQSRFNVPAVGAFGASAEKQESLREVMHPTCVDPQLRLKNSNAGKRYTGSATALVECRTYPIG